MIKKISALIIGALIATSAQAQDVGFDDFGGFMDDDVMLWGEGEKLYGATKYIKHLNEAPAIATIITAEDMQQMGATTLGDALRYVPGLAIVTTTPYGKRSVMVRGAKNIEGDLVLINIDNHSVSHFATGSATWQFLDMQISNIKRIEVIRGPGSALYGANAATAVINVITKTYKDIDGTSISARAGSFNEQAVNVLSSHDIANWKISAMMDYSDIESSGTVVKADTFGSSGELDDRKKKTEIHLKAENGPYTLTAYTNQQINGPYVGPGSGLNDESSLDSQQHYVTLAYDTFVTEDIHLRASAFYDYWEVDFYYEIYSENMEPGFDEGMIGHIKSKNYSKGIEVQMDTTLGDAHTLSFGITSVHRELRDPRSIGNYDPNNAYAPIGPIQEIAPFTAGGKRQINALFMQDVIQVSNSVEVTLGIRYDDYSDFGSTTNPRAGLVWTLSPETHLKVLHGRAFKAPNDQELHITNNPLLEGNKDLKPSIITTTEISLDHYFNQRVGSRMTLFETSVDNIIDNIAGRYENSRSQQLRGAEYELSVGQKNGHYGYANFTYINADDGETGKRLANIPSRQANIGFNANFNNTLNWYSNVRYMGSIERANADSRDKISDYHVIDTALLIHNHKRDKTLRVGVKNLLDNEYVDPDASGYLARPFKGLFYDFPHPGRRVFVEARIKL